MKRETDQYMMFVVLELHCTMYYRRLVGDSWSCCVVALLRCIAMIFVMLTKLLNFNGKTEKLRSELTSLKPEP